VNRGSLSRLEPRALILTGLAILLLATFCPAAADGQARVQQTAAPEIMTADRWARDIDFLGTELPKRHKNLFFRISEADFRKEVEALKAGLPSLTPDETLVRLLQLVASVGDSHTALGYRPQRGLPLMLYWFKDGIHVLNTTDEHKDILYGRITALGGRPIAEVTAALASVIPHENGSQVRNHVPNFLTDTAVLKGLGLIPSPDSASLTVLTESGQSLTVEMAPIPFSSKPAWLVETADDSAAPLHLRKRNVFYWFEVLPGDKAIYFKYNSCQEIPGRPFAAFVRELFAAADAGPVEKIVVDLRHNGGGNSAVFGPFLDELKKRPAYLVKGRLAVIVGRRTFSSAVLNALDLKKSAAAVFVGEPSGGKPNHHGELQTLRLPESGLTVTYSTKYFQVVDGDPEAILPDIAVEQTFAEYRAKVDPVLDAALGRRRL
jgi:Peptidase family S41